MLLSTPSNPGRAVDLRSSLALVEWTTPAWRGWSVPWHSAGVLERRVDRSGKDSPAREGLPEGHRCRGLQAAGVGAIRSLWRWAALLEIQSALGPAGSTPRQRCLWQALRAVDWMIMGSLFFAVHHRAAPRPDTKPGEPKWEHRYA